MYTQFPKISLVISIFGLLTIVLNITIINKTVPDTTALVTLSFKSLGDNDSMPLVQVRCRKTVLKILKQTGRKKLEFLANANKCSGCLKLFSNMKHSLDSRFNTELYKYHVIQLATSTLKHYQHHVPPRNNTGIKNYTEFHYCAEMGSGTGNSSGTGPGKSDYTGTVVVLLKPATCIGCDNSIRVQCITVIFTPDICNKTFYTQRLRHIFNSELFTETKADVFGLGDYYNLFNQDLRSGLEYYPNSVLNIIL